MDNKLRYQIFVIGSGGTGTYFLKEFSRYLSGGVHKEDILDLYIFDGDTVEDKNLVRQSFIADDIGQNKAVCMADALNETFGVDWMSMALYLTEKDQITQLLRRNSYERTVMPVFVGCVDNHGCRLLLEELFSELDTVGYLDSANEFYAGESVFAYKIGGRVASPVRSFYFPEIKDKDTRARTQMSCEELNNVSPQHIATNMLAGQILLSEICALLDGRPHPGLVTFDAGEYVTEYTPYKAAGGKG